MIKKQHIEKAGQYSFVGIGCGLVLIVAGVLGTITTFVTLGAIALTLGFIGLMWSAVALKVWEWAENYLA